MPSSGDKPPTEPLRGPKELVDACVTHVRELKALVDSLTGQLNNWRGFQHWLEEQPGLEYQAKRAQEACNRLELTMGRTVQLRRMLAVSATGTPEDTLTQALTTNEEHLKRRTGEWATPAEYKPRTVERPSGEHAIPVAKVKPDTTHHMKRGKKPR